MNHDEIIKEIMERTNTDLHIHTVHSDGSFTVPEIIEMIINSNIGHFSITDHDSIEGCKDMLQYESRLRDGHCISFLNGVELSCIYKGMNMHILGYGFSMDNPKMLAAVNTVNNMRKRKLELLLEHLENKHGIKIPDERVKRLKETVKNIGKPHLVEILIEMGIGSKDNVAEIYENYLDDLKTPNLKLDAKEAISAIKSAFGFSVMAHPIELMNEYDLGYDDLDRIVGELKEIGLDCMEVYYSKHTKENRERYIEIAKKHGLMTTCGSDFHGSPKPNVKLGFIGEDLTEKDYSHIAEFIVETKQ